MRNVVRQFCSKAAKQGVQDFNTASLFGKYNPGTGEEAILSMYWSSGLPFTLVESKYAA